jgi:hypothetical protein
MDPTESLVPIAEVGDPTAARVYAAMLDSAGIPVTMQGEPRGPYVMTVGQWAVTTLWVPESASEDAVEVLAAAEPDPSLVIVDPWRRDIGPMPESLRMVAWALAALFGLSALVALVRAL